MKWASARGRRFRGCFTAFVGLAALPKCPTLSRLLESDEKAQSCGRARREGALLGPQQITGATIALAVSAEATCVVDLEQVGGEPVALGNLAPPAITSAIGRSGIDGVPERKMRAPTYRSWRDLGRGEIRSIRATRPAAERLGVQVSNLTAWSGIIAVSRSPYPLARETAGTDRISGSSGRRNRSQTCAARARNSLSRRALRVSARAAVESAPATSGTNSPL